MQNYSLLFPYYECKLSATLYPNDSDAHLFDQGTNMVIDTEANEAN